MKNDPHSHILSTQQTNRVETERAVVPSASWRRFTFKAVALCACLAVAAVIAHSLWFTAPAQAQVDVPATLAVAQNLGSPDFTNPSEIRYRAAEKRLRGVMLMRSGKYAIPNVGTATLRQYRGWDADTPAPDLTGDVIAPGPTLRARLGDTVEISLLNKIDESMFSYTFDTNSKPGQSSFGCDQSGTIYPGKDFFPNCFHGSSTANIHFHGTHAPPDGLGDNVLVQVMPQVNQKDWVPTFTKIFNSGKIPQEWKDMPESYRDEQMDLVKKHDDASAAAARKNGLLPPGSLYEANKQMIASGQWPQYIMGAFPNFFKIPDYNSGEWQAGQAPGTHWYHAHKHGSTSQHILNGLAGAFVIESSREGGYDHVIRKFYGWGDSYGEHEKVMVFQQYDPTQNLERQPGAPKGKGSVDQVLLNGKLTPTINMRPGDVQLWRFVNATVGNGVGIIAFKDLFAGKTGFKFKQTAQDGVQFSRDNYQNQPFANASAPGGQVPGGLTLAGGNRADILIQAPTTPGVYTFQSGGLTLFFVKVAGTAASLPNGAFPSKAQWAEMPKFLWDLRKPGPDDQRNPNSPVKFQWEPGRTKTGRNPTTNQPPHFMINNKQFGEMGEVVDQCMPLNGLQDWVLENWTTLAHPFHIHINPFQVIKIETPSQPDPTKPPKYTNYTPPKDYIWQDVIAIPPGVVGKDGQITPGKITIRQTYLDFTGTYVLHCHILAHEDRGMMQLVRVVPANKYPAGCQETVPDHH
jgi:FtsP/CotA-like multicopper oxidase with cupredoxin domain